MKELYNKYINDELKFDKTTMLGIISLIIVISGIFGFVYEFIFYFFNSGMEYFYYRGANFLPWINIYAIGALAIFFFNRKNKKHPIRIFLLSTIICGVLEYIAGFVMYEFFDGFRCWDYNSEILNFGNINGYICLRSVLFFGASSLLLMYGIIPLCYILASKLSKKTFLILSFTLCGLFLFDELYNLIFARILHTPRSSDIYKKIGFKYMKF